MPEVLVPFSYFEIFDLAEQLHRLAQASVDELAIRGLSDVITCYGTNLEMAATKVRKSQFAQNNTLAHFAIVGASGNVEGAASIYPSIQLRKLHLPLPSFLAIGPLAERYPYATPHVRAWVSQNDPELLGQSYTELDKATRGRLWVDSPHHTVAWTIEPTRSPRIVHGAILDSGLAKVATRRFDDRDRRRTVPPRATLYAGLYSFWYTAHGRQKELKTGQSSWRNNLAREAEERLLREPY